MGAPRPCFRTWEERSLLRAGRTGRSCRRRSRRRARSSRCSRGRCRICRRLARRVARSRLWRVVVDVPTSTLELKRGRCQRPFHLAAALGANGLRLRVKLLHLFILVAALRAAIGIQRQGSNSKTKNLPAQSDDRQEEKYEISISIVAAERKFVTNSRSAVPVPSPLVPAFISHRQARKLHGSPTPA
jgi:hypothetical protein